MNLNNIWEGVGTAAKKQKENLIKRGEAELYKALLKDLEKIDSDCQAGKFSKGNLAILQGHIGVFEQTKKLLFKKHRNQPMVRKKEAWAMDELISGNTELIESFAIEKWEDKELETIGKMKEAYKLTIEEIKQGQR